MTVLELKNKLEELISKGGGDYKVFAAWESETENCDGEIIPCVYEAEAGGIEIVEHQTHYFKNLISWPNEPNEILYNPKEYRVKLIL